MSGGGAPPPVITRVGRRPRPPGDHPAGSSLVDDGDLPRRQDEPSVDVVAVQQFASAGRYADGVGGVVDEEEETGLSVGTFYQK